MTWWRDEDHYEVFFNRDELKTRQPATPPKLLENKSGVRYLSPSDPVAGGTWMLVNEHGVTVCLLNRWHETADHHGSFKSRGLLVSAMAGFSTAQEVIHAARKLEHLCYKPFTLVSIDPKEILGLAWNGEVLAEEIVSPPLTSSSYRFAEVATARRETFSNITEKTPENLKRYQRGKSPATAYTVRMNRPDAQTWSRSHVSVSTESIYWEYIEEEPNLTSDGKRHTLELRL